MSGHTPGPWRYDDNSDHASPLILGPRGEGVVSVFCGYYNSEPYWTVSEEDALLIAAAPDLLAALRVMVGVYTSLANSGDCGNWNPETEPQVIEARAAIAKAEGR